MSHGLLSQHIKGTIQIVIDVNDVKNTEFAWIIRMYSDKLEEINKAHASDVVAMFGIDFYSMDTFSNGNRYSWNLIIDTPTEDNHNKSSLTNIHCIVSLFITAYGTSICIVVVRCRSAAAETSSSKRRSVTQKARIMRFAVHFFTVDWKVYELNDTQK